MTKIHALTRKGTGLASVISTLVSIKNPLGDKSSVTAAIWDTGATNTVITKSLADELGLLPISRAIVNGVHGKQEVNVYFISLTLNNESITVNCKVTECSELSSDNSTNVLIGMNVIAMGDFAITNFNGNTTMSFRVPSLQTIDFVDGLNHSSPIVSAKQPSRNDLCPCGSKKKYKHCCGT